MTADLQKWTAPAPPARAPIVGRLCRLTPLDPHRHARSLWNACAGADDIWRFMAYGPFPDETRFEAWLAARVPIDDPLTFAVIVGAQAVGLLGFMSMRPDMGVIEIGQVLFTPSLQRTAAATEAVYLAARSVFDLGWRRLEWKCDNRNAASRRAAIRFGFAHEGCFRQHMIVKGENRDTAWFAMLDHEWPARRAAFESWLAPGNFDATGCQKRSLREFAAGP